MSVKKRICAVVGSVLCGLVTALPQTAAASETNYPDKPIRLIIPFGAGGITDVAGRVIGQHLSDELSQQIIVENRPGAGGSIAAQTLVSAKPDGYTLLLGTVGTQVVNKMLYRKLQYDPATMTPVSLISNSPYVLAVNGVEGVENLQELANYAKKNPGKLNFGSAGNGSSPHLGIELFMLSTQTDIAHIPFKSGAEAVNAAVGGQVNVVIDALPVIQPQANAQRLKILGIAAQHRNSAAPDVQTSVEQGLPEFQIGSWNALIAPPGTPAAKVDVLNKALARAMARPELVARLSEMGIEPLPTGVDAYQQHAARETEKWAQVIKAAGTQLD